MCHPHEHSIKELLSDKNQSLRLLILENQVDSYSFQIIKTQSSLKP